MEKLMPETVALERWCLRTVLTAALLAWLMEITDLKGVLS